MVAEVNATFGGVETNAVRPRAYSSTATVKQIVKDINGTYERITDQPVPNGTGTKVATGHVHDGTSGALIRMPLAGEVTDATFPRQLPTVAGGWGSAIRAPFYVPAGMTTCKLILLTTTDWSATVKANTATAALVDNEAPQTGRYVAPGGRHDVAVTGGNASIIFDLAVDPGAFNVLHVEVYDGFGLDSENAAAIDDIRRLVAWCIVPLLGETKNPPAPQTQRTTDGSPVQVATINGIASDMLADDLAISSAVVTWANQDCEAIEELLTGQPGARHATAIHTGHNHVGNGVADLDDSGAEIDHVLGAWSYGVARRKTSIDTVRPSDDEGAAPYDANPWGGRIFAPSKGAKAGASTLTKHLTRLPRLLTSSVTAGTGKVTAAVLVRLQSATSCTVTLQTFSTAVAGATLSVVTSTAGLQLLTFTGIDCHLDGLSATVQVEGPIGLVVSAADSSATAKQLTIYGTALAVTA